MIIEGDYANDRFGPVRVNGEVLEPGPSQAVWNHSPDGFAWGYYGSGPAQLALAVLLKAGLSKTEAVVLHQRFKTDVIGRLDREAFRIDVDLPAWLERNRRTTAVPTEDAQPTEEASPTEDAQPTDAVRSTGADDTGA